jgi:hypothetical protein
MVSISIHLYVINKRDKSKTISIDIHYFYSSLGEAHVMDKQVLNIV